MFLSNSFLIPITWTFNFEFFIKKLRKFIILKKNKHLPQKELNNLYELLDMKIASKYSYITTTLLISFFYLPIFPLGILISFIGFIFSFFLEKYNFINKYKKPIMLNNRIYEVYSNYFLIILFMASLGDYLFLKSVFNSKFAHFANIITFAFLLIIPYNKLLSIDFIKINESDIKKDELYEDNFYKFFNDYERNNPITKKDGIKHFLDKLLEKVLINQKEYDTILQNYENMNLLELYYKSKLHLGCNLLKRVFSLKNNSDKNNNPQPYAATDMHNLHMGDKHNNQNGHNNLPFGNVLDKSSANQITSSTTGEVTGYVGLNKYGIKVYEPRDIDKGDIARTLFYMATRYHTFKSIDNYEPALKLVTNFNDNKEVDRTISVEETQYNPAAYGILENLLEWNKMDPVSEHEIHRNNLCHKIVQGNRNPYIDFLLFPLINHMYSHNVNKMLIY
jgi:endonuclease I